MTPSEKCSMTCSTTSANAEAACAINPVERSLATAWDGEVARDNGLKKRTRLANDKHVRKAKSHPASHSPAAKPKALSSAEKVEPRSRKQSLPLLVKPTNP